MRDAPTHVQVDVSVASVHHEGSVERSVVEVGQVLDVPDAVLQVKRRAVFAILAGLAVLAGNALRTAFASLALVALVALRALLTLWACVALRAPLADGRSSGGLAVDEPFAAFRDAHSRDLDEGARGEHHGAVLHLGLRDRLCGAADAPDFLDGAECDATAGGRGVLEEDDVVRPRRGLVLVFEPAVHGKLVDGGLVGIVLAALDFAVQQVDTTPHRTSRKVGGVGLGDTAEMFDDVQVRMHARNDVTPVRAPELKLRGREVGRLPHELVGERGVEREADVAVLVHHVADVQTLATWAAPHGGEQRELVVRLIGDVVGFEVRCSLEAVVQIWAIFEATVAFRPVAVVVVRITHGMPPMTV